MGAQSKAHNPSKRGKRRPSSQLLEKPVRRRFIVEYKSRILAEAETCTQPGALGELLRREGLYSSHLATWRRQRDEGVLAGLTPKRRGRRAKAKNPLAGEVARLQRENQRLKEQLRQAELIIDVQKKSLRVLAHVGVNRSVFTCSRMDFLRHCSGVPWLE